MRGGSFCLKLAFRAVIRKSIRNICIIRYLEPPVKLWVKELKFILRAISIVKLLITVIIDEICAILPYTFLCLMIF